MKTVLIKQPAGFGDIIFCLKIAKHFVSLGHSVIWPVIRQYEYISKYMHIDGVTFLNWENDFQFKAQYMSANPQIVEILEGKDYIIIPLDAAWNKYKEGRIMDSKYRLVGLNSDNWQEHFIFSRNWEKEEKLYSEVLVLGDNEQYNLIGRNYGSPPNYLIYDGIRANNNLRNIYIEFREGYTMFDWCRVIDKASEIHMVDSGMNYIIEKLNPRAETMCLFPRWGEQTKFELTGIFKTNWEWGKLK